MKILEVGIGPNLGGIEVYFHNYYKHISSDFHFDFADKEGGLFFADEYISNGSNVFHMPDFKTHPLKYYNTIKKILRDGQYDAIHINMLSAANILPVISGYFAKIKVIIHSHNSGVPRGILRRMLHTFNKPLLNLADMRVACSKRAGKWLFGKKDFTIIPNAIDLSVFCLNNNIRQEYRNKLGYSDNALVIGHVGRFAEQKNHEFLISVFSKLSNKSDNYKLLLIGDGELKKQIISKAESLGLSDRVAFIGSVDNVPDYMQAMDLFVLPSLFEGLPVTGVESQACGLPCVFSLNISKEVKMTDNVEFVPLEDKDKWVATIEKMIKLPKSDNTEKIREAGYDINETAKQLESIYLSR